MKIELYLNKEYNSDLMVVRMETNHSIDSRGCDSLGRKPFLKGGEEAPFGGKTNDYTIKTFRSGAEHGFVTRGNNVYEILPENSPLLDAVSCIYRSVYPERVSKNPDLTVERILKGLSHPRTILKLIYYEGVPVGYGIFPRLDVDGESVLYSSRAILAEHVQQGVGTHILEDAIIRHKRETARWGRSFTDGFLMTQRWESIKSLRNIKEKGIIGKIQPIDEPFDERGERLLYVIHSQVRINSTGIEQTGRSRGELSEVGYNENLEIPGEGTEAREIFDKIVKRPSEGAGVNLFHGDVLYVRYTLPD